MSNYSSFEHFVYFTYKLEWNIPTEYEPQGYLAVFLPKSFPINLQLFRIPIDKRSGFFEKTIDACVDDFFIDCAIRKSFLHIVRYSKKDLKAVQDKIKNKPSKNNKKNNKSGKTIYQERFTCESIFLDGGKLFIPNRKETSITTNMEIFDFLTFSIQIDDELLAIPHIKKFAPTILHINKIDNLFNNQIDLETINESTFQPIYFECQVGTNSYFLVPRYDRTQKTISIDATILISPRMDQSIIFRIYDKDNEISHTTFIGSGLYICQNQNLEEEEDYSEEFEADKKQLVKSISEEKLLPKGDQNKQNNKHHHHHHHSKKKSNQNDESFIQTMKKVEEISNYRPPIQFSSPIKQKPHEPEKQKIPMTPVKDKKFYGQSPGYNELQSGRRSRIMADNQTPISILKNPQIIISNQEEILSTEVLPIKKINYEENQEFGYCQFFLLPERHANMRVISSTNDESYKNVTVSFDIYDPAARFPTPNEFPEIKRPLTIHKRPSGSSQYKINDQKKIKIIEKQQSQNINISNAFVTNDNNLSKIFPEDPKILSIEKPTIKLLRWILSCPRFSPVSLKLINFIQSFHKTTIHGFSHIINPCFKNCFRKSPDLITGFHFLSPKEEVFILETRACRPNNKASLSLELFMRNEIPPETHIIANTSIVFPAPRLYCCTENLIQRVEIPISLEDLLQVNGLYLHKNENHKLFPIAQKLVNLLQSKKSTQITGSFPIYSEIKLLEKRAPGLYATPLQKSLSITPIIHAKGADFGDVNDANEDNDNDNNNNNPTLIINNNNNNLNIINNYFVSINNQEQQCPSKQVHVKNNVSDNKERLTTYYLAKPNFSTYSRQRSESASTRFMKKSVREEMNEGKDINSGKDILIKPPNDAEKAPFQKAPRNITTTKQSI